MNVAHSADSSTRDGQRAAAAVTNDVRYSENPVQVKPQVCTDFCHVSKKTDITQNVGISKFLTSINTCSISQYGTNLTTWEGLQDFLSSGHPAVFKYIIKIK
jgi:hypothetical protein